jgi:conjugative transfer pilus assembly protein TraH
MKKLLNFLIITMVVFISIPDCFADLGNEMNKFWDKITDVSINVNSAKAFKGQASGYYTPGSISTRVPIIQQDIVNIQGPSIKAGCGGIELFAGAFSHINVDQFINQIQSIGQNALGYAFKLALATASPMIDTINTTLQEIQDDINKFNINSCETATKIVDSTVDVIKAAKTQYCIDHSSGSDYDAIRVACTSESKQNSVANNSPAEERPTNINIVWQAMKQHKFDTILGKDVAEAFMTLTGTIIIKNDKAPYPVSAKVYDSEFTKALIDGGNVTIKSCSDEECLELSNKTINLNENTAYRPRIKSMLDSIENKIKNDSGALSSQEVALIGSSGIPLLRIMVNSAISKGGIFFNSDILSELVAREQMQKFVKEITNSVRASLDSFEMTSKSGKMIAKMQINLEKVESYLEKEDIKLKKDTETIMGIIQTSEAFDRQVASAFSGRIKSVLDYSSSINTGK